MSASPAGRRNGSPRYEVRLKGHLDPRWAAWFDGLDLTTDADGTTTLRGPVVDQAALHGVLQRVRDIGLPLISVHQLDADREDITGRVQLADPGREAP
jgi:hypothetical protein